MYKVTSAIIKYTPNGRGQTISICRKSRPRTYRYTFRLAGLLLLGACTVSRGKNYTVVIF